MKRPFGLEIELSTPQFLVGHMLKEIPDFKFRNRTKEYNSNGKYWDLKPEASSECEIATPLITLGGENHNKFKQVMEAISDSYVTCEDGIHVHVHVPDIEMERLFIAWLYIEYVVLRLFPVYRKNNEYIQLCIIKYRKGKRLSHYIGPHSYVDAEFHHSTMSLERWPERQSVEFRLHEGTTCYEDIIHWVKFILYFIEFARTVNIIELLGKLPLKDPMKLSETLKLPYELTRWTDKRMYLYA